MKTALKTIFTISCSFLLAFTIHAQDSVAPYTASIQKDQVKKNLVKQKKSIPSDEEMYQLHTSLATTQFIQHLALNVSYSDDLKSYGLEGIVIVEILLDQQGTITTTSVFQSLHPAIDQLVVDQIIALQRINLDGRAYQGAKRLRIPVDFSLR